MREYYSTNTRDYLIEGHDEPIEAQPTWDYIAGKCLYAKRVGCVAQHMSESIVLCDCEFYPQATIVLPPVFDLPRQFIKEFYAITEVMLDDDVGGPFAQAEFYLRQESGRPLLQLWPESNGQAERGTDRLKCETWDSEARIRRRPQRVR